MLTCGTTAFPVFCIAVKAASELTAFLNMYKAACKRYAVPVDKPLTEEVEAKLLDFKPLEKVGRQHILKQT